MILQIERRIAPFWRGLNDHKDSWTENQLVAVAQGRPLPAPDEIPVDETNLALRPDVKIKSTQANLDSLTVPIISRAQSFNSDTSSNISPAQPTFHAGATNPPSSTSSSIGAALSRGRAKTLASLGGSSKSPQVEITPREVNLPKDRYVSGQPIEAYLYKDASECPICFLYYPPYLNKTRCCDQAICSECFVQIKRPDPHAPEHTDPSAPPLLEGNSNEDVLEGELVSEPAACPFCVQPEFGITYEPPLFRRGLAYASQTTPNPLANSTAAMSSSSSLASGTSNESPFPLATRRRTTSVSANSPLVITTDRVRPDWHQKLTAARAHTARRSAAATALHTAAYLMGNRGQEQDVRTFGAFGRRGILRRSSGADSPSAGTSSSQLSMLALMSERYAAQAAAREDNGAFGEGEQSVNPPPRGSSRRGRVDDLEEMMMMEAIRLSIASEDERRKREEKDAKKEAKKKDKEDKKAEKVAKKAGVYPSSANASSASLRGTQSDIALNEQPSSSGKGKSVQPTNPDPTSGKVSGSSTPPTADPQTHLERARKQILPSDSSSPSPYGSMPYKPSHLRTLSNASSSGSSIEGSAPNSLKSGLRVIDSSIDGSPHASNVNIAGGSSTQDTYLSGTPPGGGAGTEPMFNFSSLAAMVGDDEKAHDSLHTEYTGNARSHSQQRGESSVSRETRADLGGIVPGPVLQNDPRLQLDGTADHVSPPIFEAQQPMIQSTAPTRVNSDLEKGSQTKVTDTAENEMATQEQATGSA